MFYVKLMDLQGANFNTTTCACTIPWSTEITDKWKFKKCYVSAHPSNYKQFPVNTSVDSMNVDIEIVWYRQLTVQTESLMECLTSAAVVVSETDRSATVCDSQRTTDADGAAAVAAVFLLQRAAKLHVALKALYMLRQIRPFVCLSVCPPVTLRYYAKMTERRCGLHRQVAQCLYVSDAKNGW